MVSTSWMKTPHPAKDVATYLGSFQSGPSFYPLLSISFLCARCCVFNNKKQTTKLRVLRPEDKLKTHEIING